MTITLGNFIEKLQKLESLYGSCLPVELPNDVPACPPVINPVVGRYAVIIHPFKQPDFSQGNLIYRAQLLEELDRIYMLRTQDDMEAELLKLIRQIKTYPNSLTL